MKRPVSMTRKPATTTYEDWIKGEGIPILEDWGIEDVKTIERKPWARMGGKGAFIYLHGMKGAITGMYVTEIPPGKALNPEKHLYEEMVYILKGQGATEIWQEGQPKRTFEWGEGSLFSPPINTWHRLYNGGREPVLFLGVTNAPIVMDLFHSPEFVFEDNYIFQDRPSANCSLIPLKHPHVITEKPSRNQSVRFALRYALCVLQSRSVLSPN